jgi:hypothetical protein
MDYKVKLTKCQNEHHHRGAFDMWTKWAQGPASQPKSLVDRPGFESARSRTWLTHVYIGSQGMIQGLKVMVAKRSHRPTMWMVSRPSICSKPTLPSWWRLPSACSSPLVKVSVCCSSTGEFLLGVKSRALHSLELRK